MRRTVNRILVCFAIALLWATLALLAYTEAANGQDVHHIYLPVYYYSASCGPVE